MLDIFIDGLIGGFEEMYLLGDIISVLMHIDLYSFQELPEILCPAVVMIP